MTPDPAVDTGPDAAAADPELGYAAAVAELSSILADLEDDTLDIDVLGDKVERAAVLIAACRARIDAARLRVDQIVADLDGLPADDD